MNFPSFVLAQILGVLSLILSSVNCRLVPIFPFPKSSDFLRRASFHPPLQLARSTRFPLLVLLAFESSDKGSVKKVFTCVFLQIVVESRRGSADPVQLPHPPAQKTSAMAKLADKLRPKARTRSESQIPEGKE